MSVIDGTHASPEGGYRKCHFGLDLESPGLEMVQEIVNSIQNERLI